MENNKEMEYSDGSDEDVGGEQEQSPNNPEYLALAEESLQKYLQTKGNAQPHKVVRVIKVTSQIVCGTLTKIDFEACRTNQDTTALITCHAKVWERIWLQKKDIEVSCQLCK